MRNIVSTSGFHANAMRRAVRLQRAVAGHGEACMAVRDSQFQGRDHMPILDRGARPPRRTKRTRHGARRPIVRRERRPGHACGARTPAREARLPDALRFLIEWLRDPVGTAAVAPSGRALAALITREVGPGTGPVLELGPGTGVFTDALVARGVDEGDLVLVEQNESFARLLQRRFARATVLGIDAAALPRGAGGPHGFGAVICGLGFRNMPAAQIEAIVGAAVARMATRGAFYFFTYGRRCSVPEAVLRKLGLHAERVGIALRNVPPASVYRLTRAG